MYICISFDNNTPFLHKNYKNIKIIIKICCDLHFNYFTQLYVFLDLFNIILNTFTH